MEKLRPIALILCLLILSGCAAAPPARPDDTPSAGAAEQDGTADEAYIQEASSEASPEQTENAPDPETGEAGDGPEAGTAGSAEEAPAPAVVETPAQEPEQAFSRPQLPQPPAPFVEEEAPAGPPAPPESAAPGFWETEAGLYYIQEDGTCLTDGSVGYLAFGPDGCYTSGDADLDAGINSLIAGVCSDLSMDSESRLRLLYNHIRDNYRYLSMEHYEAGSTSWGNSAALTMLSLGKGNCYNFTALFTACARRLGYQAYNVAGHEWSADNDHAWTMIDWPDGVTYLFDVQLEYAYLYMYSNKPQIDMFKVSGGSGSYNGFAYYFP